MRQSTLKTTSTAITLLVAGPLLVGTPAIADSPKAAKAANPPTLTKLVLPYTVMTPLPDGRTMGIFTSGPDVFGRYSSDDGRTWTELEKLCSLPKSEGTWSCHDIVIDRKGELHLILGNFFTTKGKDAQTRIDIWHAHSTNGRTAWKPPTLLRKGYHGSMLSVICLKSGRIVLPITYLTKRTWPKRGEGADAFTWMGTFSGGILYTDDGDNWKEAAIELKTPTPYIGADGIVEPIVIERKDGSAWMLLRTQMGRLFESTSKDGAVWTKPTPTSIISSDSPPSLTRTPDGRIVLLWNNAQRYAYAQGGRHVMHGAVSEDEGRTWHGYREVAANPYIDDPAPSDGDHGVAYIIPTATKGGDVIAPVSMGHGPEGVLFMRVDPHWLDETSAKADFASGAKDWHSFGTKGVEVVANPDKPGASTLHIRKTEPDWPSAVTWNFPNGTSGRLKMRVKLNPGFGGVRIGLTDHFSVPFDPEESCFNLFNLNIPADGKLSQGTITPGEWHNVQLDWNCAKLTCKVTVDGRQVETLPLQRRTAGVNYIRFTSTAEDTDRAGMLIDSVEVTVTP